MKGALDGAGLPRCHPTLTTRPVRPALFGGDISGGEQGRCVLETRFTSLRVLASPDIGGTSSEDVLLLDVFTALGTSGSVPLGFSEGVFTVL